MARKKKISANYLEQIPQRKEGLEWSVEEEKVVLHIENKGFFNKIAQLLFKKPKVSHIHLDDMGSFIWPLIDGEKKIFDLGEPVKEHFGEEAEPLYPRLAEFFRILEAYGFVEFKK